MSRARKVFIALLALTICLLLALDSRCIVDAGYLTLVSLILAFILLLTRGDKSDRHIGKKEKNLTLLLSVCLTVLFIFMLSASQILSSGLYSYTKLKEIYSIAAAMLYTLFARSLYPMAVFCSLVFLFSELLLFAAAQDEGGELCLKKVRYFGIYYYLLPVVLLVLCYLFCSFPNYRLGDSFMCWDQAVAGEWNDWDPIGYIFFLRLCSKIWNSYWIVRIIQSVLYIYICNTALKLLERHTRSKRACGVYVLLSSFVLTPYIYLQLTYKDVLFSMSLFAFSLCILDAIAGEKVSRKHMLAFVAFGLIVVLFRHGSSIPVLAGGGVLCLIFLLGKKRADCLRTVGSLAILFLLKFLIVDLLAFQILNAVRNPDYVKYSLPMVLAGAMASDQEVELTEDEITVMEIITPLERWRESYAGTGNGYWADPISRDWSTIGSDIRKIDEYDLGEALLRLNFSLFRRYPVKYLTVFFNCNSLVWEMGRPSDGYEWAPVEGTCFEFAEGYPSEEEMPRTAMTNFMLELSNASSRIPIVRSFTWRGGIWSFSLLLSAVLLLLKGRGKELAAFLPILLVLAMLMLAMPAQDPRYILGAVECGSFFLVYAVFVKKNKENEV